MPSTIRRATVAFEEAITTQATIDVGSLWDRLRGEFLDEYARQARAGLSGDSLDNHMQEFMDSLSTNWERDMANQSAGVAYNQGRGLTAQQAKTEGRALYAVRSEVLDQKTCASCATLDGTVVEIGTAEYQALMPPARCEGGDRCRGFFVVISERGQA
jgi:hypothetical protein